VRLLGISGARDRTSGRQENKFKTQHKYIIDRTKAEVNTIIVTNPEYSCNFPQYFGSMEELFFRATGH
jgi:hypothetical protein